MTKIKSTDFRTSGSQTLRATASEINAFDTDSILPSAADVNKESKGSSQSVSRQSGVDGGYDGAVANGKLQSANGNSPQSDSGQSAGDEKLAGESAAGSSEGTRGTDVGNEARSSSTDDSLLTTDDEGRRQIKRILAQDGERARAGQKFRSWKAGLNPLVYDSNLNLYGNEDNTSASVIADSKTRNMWNELGKVLNTEIRFVERFLNDTGTEEKALGNIVTGRDGKRVLSVAVGGDEQMTGALMHEAVHEIKRVSPEDYDALRSYIRSKYKSEADYRADVRKSTGVYEGLNEEFASFDKQFGNFEEEYISKQVEDTLTSAESLERVLDGAPEDVRSVFRKIRDWFAGLAAKLSGKNTVGAKAALKEVRAMEQILNTALEKRRTGVRSEEIGVRGRENAGEGGRSEDVGSRDEGRDTGDEENARRGTEKWSIRQDEDGNQYVDADTDQDIFAGKAQRDYPKIARQYILNKFRNTPLQLSDNGVVRVTQKSAGEYTNRAGYAKTKVATELDNLLSVSQYDHSADETKGRAFASGGWDYYTVKFAVDGHMFTGLINIAKSDNGALFYDMTKITPSAGRASASKASIPSLTANGDDTSISPSAENVNTQNENSRQGLVDSRQGNDGRAMLAPTGTDGIAGNPAVESTSKTADGTEYGLSDGSTVTIPDSKTKWSIAYHGSPYKFDQFLLEHIGDGEGAQAHGWGLYFAADKSVSEGYSRDLAKGNEEYYIDGRKLSDDEVYIADQIELGKTLEEFEADLKDLYDYKDKAERDIVERYIRGYSDIAGKDITKQTVDGGEGSLYTVEIPDEDVMLNEGLPLSEQPEAVREAIDRLADDYPTVARAFEPPKKRLFNLKKADPPDGNRIYEILKEDKIVNAMWSNVRGDETASKLLNKYDIKGITYTGGHDGKCYVVFDDTAVKILDGVEIKTGTNEGTNDAKWSLSAEGVGNLDSYSDREKANWSGSKRIVLYDSPAQLKQFVENARAKNNLDKKMYFGKIPADIAAGIEAETGVNITGNNLSLSAMEIRKIIAKHGDNATENKRGQRSIVLDDFAAIPSIVTEYDKVTLAGTHNGRPVLLFEKEINGKTTAVTYTSERSRDLIVQTMYSGKSKSSIARAATGEPAASTSETTSGTTALSDTSISPSAENVNSKISAEAGVNDGNVNSKYSLSETENGGAAEAELEEGVPAFITRQRDAVRAAYNQADAKAKAKGMGVRASRASAKGIKEDLHSTLSLTKMHEGLRDAVTAYQKGKDLSFEALYNSLTPLAWEIAHSAEVEITYTDGSGTDWVNPYYGDMDNSVRMITNALAAHLADAKPVYDKTLEAVRDWAQRRAAGVERANELIRKYNSGRADTIKPSGRENFEAPEHIGGMGIKIDGSNGEYSGVDTLIKNEDAYKRYDTFVKAEIKRLKPSDEDIRIARQLANGDIDITSISDIKDKRRLTDFADMFATQNALASGLIAERRRAVARYEDTGSDYFLEGVTEVKQAGKLTMNLLTPERLVKRAFGERAGTRIYEHFFAPVQANESERLRYAGELLDQLREFEGSDGKVRALNDAESEAVFTMLEAENIEERIDREYLSDYIRQLADQLIEDAGVNAERIVRDYSFIRPNSQWKTAERLNTKQIALAQNYAQMKVLEKEFSAGTVDKTRVENSVKVLCSHYVSRDQPRSRGEQSKVGSQCRR